MPIQLFDSLERKLKPLTPSHPDGVYRFYNCGPTVYAAAHIGNFRTFVVNDVLRRLLELEHPGKVKHVRNLTDVDDKTIKRARDEGRSLAEVTKQWTDKFHADCDALNCLRPHVEPTATGHIQEQVDMIDVLMKKGNAYRAADGSVYFKVSSFDNYGRLSRVKERELQVGTALLHKSQAVDADEKEDATDFALWKAHKTEDGANSWDSPWGPGRPGWHIECSAMSKKHLGDTIDRHAGGEDLLFPHHENEIAQSECCNGTLFAHHWYHSKHLLVDGAKMSKSLGNLYTLDDLIAKGFSPMALRYALLAGHPRKQLNFTLDGLHAAESALKSLTDLYENLRHATFADHTDKPSSRFKPVIEALADDLNTPNALGILFSIRAEVEKTMKGSPGIHISKGDVLGLEEVLFALGIKLQKTPIPQLAAPAAITALADKRWAAKAAKDWAAADALRKEIAAAGWNMKDAKDGYTLEPLKK